ncbi:MAG: hypothetical protein AB8F95_05705 [Bacteroidia bacterium]
MLVQYYYPHSISPGRLDRYLAAGWFRGGAMLYRSPVICLADGLHTVINVRLPLRKYTFSKSHKKLLRKNDARFRVEIGNPMLTPEREHLYNSHRDRFRGFVFDSLAEFLQMSQESNLFHTRELRVFDGDKLVSVSYFDEGSKGVASILGLYDESYKKYRLGIYTMLYEIRECIKNSKKFYYPGYILDGHEGFDYKLKLGKMQYYSWKGRWRSLPPREEDLWYGRELQSKTKICQDELTALGFETHFYANPFFSLGYLDFLEEGFVRGPVFLEVLEKVGRRKRMIIEYDIDQDLYLLSLVEARPEHQDYLTADLSQDIKQASVNSSLVLSYSDYLTEHTSPKAIVSWVAGYLKRYQLR